jgi:hypothetical protein
MIIGISQNLNSAFKSGVHKNIYLRLAGIFLSVRNVDEYPVVENMTSQLTNVFIFPGKTLVHEWGHFRWGVFDEYPIQTHYYIDKGRYQPTQ